ncbi:hypothetical protein TNCV_4985601 [Trichonephila clavipes]|nr:hypothetical protein TNCV_4985601 [Trichonephila clavipes]
MPPGQAHRTLHCQRSPSDHGESRRAHLHEHERLVHAPLPVEYLPFCVRGKLSLMVVKGTKKFPRALETLPESNDAFPNSLHVSDCTILPICQIPAAV